MDATMRWTLVRTFDDPRTLDSPANYRHLFTPARSESGFEPQQQCQICGRSSFYGSSDPILLSNERTRRYKAYARVQQASSSKRMDIYSAALLRFRSNANDRLVSILSSQGGVRTKRGRAIGTHGQANNQVWGT